MGQGEEVEILRILLIGVSGMSVMALAIILFFIIYQKRLLKQQKEQRTLESSHQKDLLEASLKSQENERLRIAKDLHDDIGALLSTSKLYIGQLLDKSEDQEKKLLVQKVERLHEDMIQSIRNIAQNLRPAVLENMGLVAAIKSLAKQINESRWLTVEFTYDHEALLAKERQLQLYRILQELITNTLKHARARTIHIELTRDGQCLRLVYKDDGIGFDPGRQAKKHAAKGLGLLNIESRLALLDGSIRYRDTRAGTDISLVVPNDLTNISENEH